MKKMLFVVVALCAAAVFAEGAEVQKPKGNFVTIDGKQVAAKDVVPLYLMKKFGGMIRQPNTEQGKIVFVNTQKTVDRALLEKIVKSWSNRYRLVIEISEADVKSSSDLFVIRLIDSDREEGIILAPENFWVSVNIKALAKDNPPKVALADRFEKQVKRAFAFVCCGTCSNEAGGLCGVVKEPSDLDAIVSKRYSPDIDVRMTNNMRDTGVKPYRVCKYLTACQEGWAPQPTNEFQKAVWDEVHQLPTAPITIKPEEKKVAE